MRPPPSPSRRALLRGLGAASLLGPAALHGPQARASVSASRRRFLFFLCRGGWDTTTVFAPLFDNSLVDMEFDATAAEVGGISFVDHAERPAVRAFFEANASRTAVLNGFEVRSITHERCLRLLYTGEGEVGADGWPEILAGHAADQPLLPHLVLSGPSFGSRYRSGVVRTGTNGQLSALLDGSALDASDQAPADRLSQATRDQLEAALSSRVADWTATAPAGVPTSMGGAHLDALDRLAELRRSNALLDAEPLYPLVCGEVWDQVATALTALEEGLSRCVSVTFDGWCANGFDTHAGNAFQSVHFDLAFEHLVGIMQELDARPGQAGGSLADETTVVVLSEMGRHPQLNSLGGRDHWTTTSAMLVGSGVAGGQVVGGYDDEVVGAPTALSTGELSSGGTRMLSSHLGATLLALGDVDPGGFVGGGIEPIGALLD